MHFRPISQTDRHAFRYILPPIKNCDLFILNSYKDKLYIKMLKFSKEID